ncbi:MAG: GAF domain-containing protein [Chloroflexi bacterium]|nr:GAF domain-containing protein [Chloroflexota bacterium]
MTEPAVRFLQQELSRLQDENKLLHEEISSLHGYLKTIGELFRATQRLESGENLLELLDELLNNIIEVTRAKDGSISRMDQASNELEFVLVHGDIRQELQGYRITSDAGIAGWVVNHREPLIVNNPRQDWRFSHEVDQEFNFLTRSIMCVPIVAEDKLVGVIQLLNKAGDEFTESDLAVLSMLSQVAAKVLTAVPA